MDDLSSGRRDNVPEGTSFYELDVRDAELGEVMAAESPDVVSHHAANAVRVEAQAPAMVMPRQKRPSQKAIPNMGAIFQKISNPSTTPSRR